MKEIIVNDCSDEGQIMLPNGCTLYWEKNMVGGRRYYSDEVGGGVEVWDTACVDKSTLLMAMAVEDTLNYKELKKINETK